MTITDKAVQHNTRHDKTRQYYRRPDNVRLLKGTQDSIHEDSECANY